MTIHSGLGLLLAGIVALPALPAMATFRAPSSSAASELSTVVARGGGGGSRGGGRGDSSSRGNRGGGGGGARTGFSTAGGGGGLNRGASRPDGGWSSNSRGPRAGGSPSLDRRPGTGSGGTRGSGATNVGDRNQGNRNLGDRNLSDRNLNQNLNRNVERNWNRTVNINNVNLRPGWARPGWGYARPWNYGWYGGWASPSWGWWGARAAVWGIGALASAAIINEAVDNAINSQQTMFVVPNSNYQLLYGTVQPLGSTGVQFAVNANGNTYQLSADCQSGLLNGVQPASAAEAELLNAACQVAFGNS